MLQSLQDFVDTLNIDMQELVAGKKTRGVINILLDEGIEVPEYILEEFEQASLTSTEHDYLIESMSAFL